MFLLERRKEMGELVPLTSLVASQKLSAGVKHHPADVPLLAVALLCMTLLDAPTSHQRQLLVPGYLHGKRVSVDPGLVTPQAAYIQLAAFCQPWIAFDAVRRVKIQALTASSEAYAERHALLKRTSQENFEI